MTEINETAQANQKKIVFAIALLLIMALGLFGYWFFFMRGIVYSDDARIDANMVDLAPQVGGVITQVNFNEGDLVKKDQVMFELDKNLLQAALTKAEADVASAQAALAAAQAQYDKALHGPLADEIRIAQTAVEKAAAEKQLADMNWSRAKVLFDQQALSAADRDREKTTWELAKWKYEEALERLNLLKKGTRSEDISAAKAALDAKKADLNSAKARLEQTRINVEYSAVLSPFPGVIVRRWRDPGATVAAGTPILTLLDPATLHVAANIDEKNLDKIEVGDTVDISVDAYPNLRLTGHVEKILRATNSQFSLIPSEGTSGTFIKVAQRVPLRITFDNPSDLPLGPGLSVEVRIHSHSNSQQKLAKLHE
jgi:membrane fusion protein (multidrug efflux system)